MRIQNLAIVFLVITIPLILILSYYLNLQQDTLKLQVEYDTKLAEATREGIKAFEVNTVDWSNKKQNNRETTTAMINAFTTSLANNLNISGIAREYMLNYIPAVAVTVYDGYYIYEPLYVAVTAESDKGLQLFHETGTINTATTDVDKGEILYKAKEGGSSYRYTNSNGVTQTIMGLTTDISKAEMQYKHVLNNRISYSTRYMVSGKNLVVNYTLDNRIYVYGDDIDKNGYLVYFDMETVLPNINIGAHPKSDSDINVTESIANTVVSKTKIEPETLTEQILYKEENTNEYKLKTFKYVYDIQKEKLYYDDTQNNFFILKTDKTRSFLNNSEFVGVGNAACKYKSVSVLLGGENTTEYKKIYQVLNGKDKGKWYISIKDINQNQSPEVLDTEISNTLKLQNLGINQSLIYKDYSAISYYVEAYAFTNWIKQNLTGDVQQLKLTYDQETKTYITTTERVGNVFKIDKNNNPEDTTSPFVEHKREVMKNNIITNLDLAITNYGYGTYEFKLPVLTDSDWEKVFSNISMITFFQGAPIGLKHYNNYAIATSTTNREYVSPQEIYFSGNDANYHRVYCEKCKNISYTGYRSVEYVLKESSQNTNKIYYYQHDNNSNVLDKNSETACYYCIVNQANFKATSDLEVAYKQAKAYNEALARERYYQKENLRSKVGITIYYFPNLNEEVQNMPQNQLVDIGAQTTISSQIPRVETGNIEYIFKGWTTDPNSNRVEYNPGDIEIFDKDTKLYAVWESTSLVNLNWKMDYLWKKSETFDQALSHNMTDGVWDGSISYIDVNSNNGTNQVRMVGNSELAGKRCSMGNI